MTDAERQSLAAVLEYMSGEQEHYAACAQAGESVEKHIYTHVQVLENYLECHAHAEKAAAGLYCLS